jgi:hypothetical protein
MSTEDRPENSSCFWHPRTKDVQTQDPEMNYVLDHFSLWTSTYFVSSGRMLHTYNKGDKTDCIKKKKKKIIEEYHCYQLHTKFYPAFFCQV